MKKIIFILICSALLAGCQANTAEDLKVDAQQVIHLVPAQSENSITSPDSDQPDSSAIVPNSAENERTVYQPGFFYEPLSNDIKERITGISYQENSTISYNELRYVQVLYFDFNEKECSGELICNEAIAQDLVEIFYELHQAKYLIEKICLIDEYGGDDEASMEDNNSSCFNYRVISGTTKLSQHALGLAIDINPLYNPYVTNLGGELNVVPANAAAYADRNTAYIAKITHDDLAYRLFAEHGFTWGGDWKNSKDYQHFQKAE
ncbi:MAG: M15 family metallopeptidase [Lachnospiraceae bacterium]